MNFSGDELKAIALRNALEKIASFDDASMAVAKTLHWDMRGWARAAMAAELNGTASEPSKACLVMTPCEHHIVDCRACKGTFVDSIRAAGERTAIAADELVDRIATAIINQTVSHGDQYGGWQGTCEYAKEHGETVLQFKGRYTLRATPPVEGDGKKETGNG